MTSQRMISVGSSKNGSSTAVAGSGIRIMSDSLMPFQPAIDEPSNILPSSKKLSSTTWCGTVTCCSLPRVSVKRRSTNLTSFSFISLRTSATDIGFPPFSLSANRSSCRSRSSGCATDQSLCYRAGQVCTSCARAFDAEALVNNLFLRKYWEIRGALRSGRCTWQRTHASRTVPRGSRGAARRCGACGA